MTLDELTKSLIPQEFPRLSGNVYCIGRNYHDHISELKNEVPKEPVVFLKAPSALRPMAAGTLACANESFHHEIELVLLVSKHIPMGSQVDESVIRGISLGLDLTRRELQNELKAKGLPWTLAKSFASSGILHPFVEFRNSSDIDFQLFVNGDLRQSGQSRNLIFDFKFLLNFLLRYQDLHAGDIVYTGTPAGVAGFRQGDEFQFVSKVLGIDAKGRL